MEGQEILPNRNRSNLAALCVILSIFLIILIFGSVVLLRSQEPNVPAYVSHRIDHFPHPLRLCDKPASVSFVHTFELYANHGYNGYMLILIDRRSLTDDDIYWMMKGMRMEWELDADAYIYPNGLDNDSVSMRLLSCRYTENYIYFIFRTDTQRHSLKGGTFHGSISYRPEGASHNETERYYFFLDFVGDQYHDSTDFLSTETLNVLAQAMIDATS